MRLSIIIPVCNEEDIVEELHRRLSLVLGKIAVQYEIIFVDDGSTDATVIRIRALEQKDHNIRCLSFSRNFGHQIAVSAGMDHATGDAVVIMDGDLQDPPEVIPEFVKKFEEGFDVVYGVRKKRKENIFKRASYALFYRLLKSIATVDLPLDSGDFSLISERVAHIVRSMPERNRYVRGLRSWVGFRQTGIVFERDKRFGGDPKYSFRKLLALAYDGIFSFSYFPLKLVTLLGFVFSISAFAGIVYVLYLRFFVGRLIPGFYSTAIIILIFSGLQMFSLGIMGEYIGRISDETKKRPLYIIKETINIHAKD